MDIQFNGFSAVWSFSGFRQRSQVKQVEDTSASFISSGQKRCTIGNHGEWDREVFGDRLYPTA